MEKLSESCLDITAVLKRESVVEKESDSLGPNVVATESDVEKESEMDLDAAAILPTDSVVE